MKKVLGILLVSMLTACSSKASYAPLDTEKSVDLTQYVGTWYEQAKLPNRFQRQCIGDTQAIYSLKADSSIEVLNSCRVADGSFDEAKGQARLATAVQTPDSAKLEVRFAPAWMSFIPAVWGDYWILKIAGDYEYSLVGTPDRQYLWVLSRAKQADATVVNELLDYAQEWGFATEGVVRAE